MDRRTAADPLPARLKASEARCIRLGGRVIEYRFSRRRRRTLGISIDADGLAVAAPLRAPMRDIESFMHDKERWILSKLDEWACVPRPRIVRVADGESVPVFGAPLRLEVREGGRAVRHDGARLVVSAPGSRRVAQTLIGWLKSMALDSLAPRVEHFAGRLGLPSPCVALSNARGQWGVCMEGGHIRLNWRLVHLAPALGDYVAAHEVAHLVEMNHSKRFWHLVSSLYPAWREARAALELAGASIPIIREAQ
jgi:predicted metal-dependent hydrolase